MENLNARSLYQALSADRCAFGYSGSFQDDHTVRLIELGEALIADQNAGPSTSSRLGYMMVEAYQNIIRHREEGTAEIFQGKARSLFLLKCQEGSQQVVTINPVMVRQGRKLDGLLSDIQKKDGPELKQLFLSALQHAAGKDSRGAGLGLIEMARRSGNGPAWSLHPIDDGMELFALGIRLGAAVGKEGILTEAMEIHGMVGRGKIRLFHSGPRPPAVRAAIQKLILAEYPSEKDKIEKGRVIDSALELMPTQSHGRPGSGLIILSQEKDRLKFVVGTLMSATDAAMKDALAPSTKQATPSAQAPLSALAETLQRAADVVSFISQPMDEGHLGLLRVEL